MATITLAANATTLILNGTAITDFEEGDVITITPTNPSTSHVNSLGGGVNINERSDKGVVDVTVRVQKYSESDAFLNNIDAQSPPVVLNGSAQTNYNRDGEDGVEVWRLESGSITSAPTITTNTTDGNATSEYVIRFRNGSRSL